MSRIHPKFWKCLNYERDATSKCYHQCNHINASGKPCKNCGHFEATANAPVTNQEVLIAWLTADDERRKEIEIASRPSEDCHVKEYLTYWMYEPTGTPRDSLWSYSDYTAHRDYPNVGGLWLPIGEPDSQVKQ